MNRRFSKFLVIVLAAMTLPLLSLGQEGPLEKKDPPPPLTPDEIIQRFAAKEKTFAEARENYTYTQDVRVEATGPDGETGEFRQVTDITFDNQGHRIEHVTYAPQSSLDRGGISMTREDFEDIEKRMPFVLTTDEIPEYDILYVGQQQEDELHCYVFDIAPKRIEKDKRYFQGRIWVDDHDFQIVKTHGKNVPDLGTHKKNAQENLFPEFTTWRQQIDGKYWFPTYTLVDDDLHFRTGDVHVKQVVKYENYKRFGSNVKITYEGQDVKPGQQNPQQQQPGQQPPPSTPPPNNPN